VARPRAVRWAGGFRPTPSFLSPSPPLPVSSSPPLLPTPTLNTNATLVRENARTRNVRLTLSERRTWVEAGGADISLPTAARHLEEACLQLHRLFRNLMQGIQQAKVGKETGCYANNARESGRWSLACISPGDASPAAALQGKAHRTTDLPRAASKSPRVRSSPSHVKRR